MKSVFLSLILFPSAVLSQTSGEVAHEHGTGHLDITFSEAGFSLSLVVPAADIVGFEGPAETDDDRALVAVAISELSKPLELFVLPEEAGCFSASANVTLSGEALGQDSGDVQSADQTEHTEFRADYQIQCQDFGLVEGIEFLYFDNFPNAQRLIVRTTQSGETGTTEITRDQPRLAF